MAEHVWEEHHHVCLLDNDLPNLPAEEPLNKRMRRIIPPVSLTGQFLFHQPYSQSLGGSNAGGDFSTG